MCLSVIFHVFSFHFTSLYAVATVMSLLLFFMCIMRIMCSMCINTVFLKSNISELATA